MYQANTKPNQASSNASNVAMPIPNKDEKPIRKLAAAGAIISVNTSKTPVIDQNFTRLNFDITCLTLRATRRLMHHNTRIWQRETAPFFTPSQQQGAHRSCLPDAHCAYGTADVLHGIINCQTGRNHTTRAVDVKRDFLVRIHAFQIQKLRGNQGCNLIDRSTDLLHVNQ